MNKYALTAVLVVLCGLPLFAQSTLGGAGGQASLDFGVPIDLWSFDFSPDETRKYSDVSFSAGFGVKYFWSNNLGIFGDFHAASLLSREWESQNGTKVTESLDDFSTNLGLSVTVGPAYRIPIGSSAGLYIGIGPRYSLQVLSLELVGRLRTGGTVPVKATYSFHIFGLAVEPGITVNIGKLVFDAGLGLSFNLFRSVSRKLEVGSASRGSSAASRNYFGFTISPHLGLVYSF